MSRSVAVCALIWAFEKRLPISVAEIMIKQKRPKACILGFHHDNLVKALELLYQWSGKPFPDTLRGFYDERD